MGMGGRSPLVCGLLVITGSLADAPIGRCFSEQLSRALVAVALPAEVLNHTLHRRYDWVAGSDKVAIRAR